MPEQWCSPTCLGSEARQITSSYGATKTCLRLAMRTSGRAGWRERKKGGDMRMIVARPRSGYIYVCNRLGKNELLCFYRPSISIPIYRPFCNRHSPTHHESVFIRWLIIRYFISSTVHAHERGYRRSGIFYPGISSAEWRGRVWGQYGDDFLFRTPSRDRDNVQR
jgi:hypothetical protein